jgi:hypothetical protein
MLGQFDVLHWFVVDPITNFDEHKFLEVFKHVNLNANSILRLRLEKSIRLMVDNFP